MQVYSKSKGKAMTINMQQPAYNTQTIYALEIQHSYIGQIIPGIGIEWSQLGTTPVYDGENMG